MTIPHQDLTYQIIGAAMRVHRNTPRGLREKHYQRALTRELHRIGLSSIEEHPVQVYDTENQWLGNLYLDHWVNNCIVIEDKAFTCNLSNKELAQIIAYLTATQAPVGLLFNFGRSRLEYKRILPPKTVTNWQDEITPYLSKRTVNENHEIALEGI
jgi:GxxExxY protein